jgi:hypothetical protein
MATEVAVEAAGETAAAAAENVESAAENAAAEMREPLMRDGYVTAEEADLNTEMLTGAPVYEALLHKSADGRASPIPGQTHPTASVTGMPSAV